MELFTCRTRNNEDPDSKTKVYISYTADVSPEIIEEVAEKLNHDDDYAVYMADLSVPYDESFEKELSKMDKVVFFIDEEMFSTESRALYYELPLAMMQSKDLMPVDNGTGLIDIFLTCCEHIPEAWTRQNAIPLVKRTLLLSYAEMAGALQVKHDYEGAEDFLLKAQKLSEEITLIAKDQMSLDDESICMMNIGINRAFMEDWEGAYSYVRKGLDKTEDLIAFSRTLDAMKRKQYCYRVLGELSRTMEDWDRAMQWFDAAVFYGKCILEVHPDEDTMESLPLALVRLAECHDRKAEQDEAIELYTEALDLYKDMEEKDLAPSWLLKEMCSSAMRAFQLIIGTGNEARAAKYQAYSGHLLTRITAGELARKEKEEKGPSTIALPNS